MVHGRDECIAVQLTAGDCSWPDSRVEAPRLGGLRRTFSFSLRGGRASRALSLLINKLAHLWGFCDHRSVSLHESAGPKRVSTVPRRVAISAAQAGGRGRWQRVCLLSSFWQHNDLTAAVKHAINATTSVIYRTSNYSTRPGGEHRRPQWGVGRHDNSCGNIVCGGHAPTTDRCKGN